MTKQIENPRFPNNIRAFRERAGLKLNRLAELIGMTPGNLSRIERGDVNVTSDVLQRVGKVLSIAPGLLIDASMLQAEIEASASNARTVDGHLLEDCVTLIMDVCEERKIIPTSRNIAEWSSYLYAEAMASKKAVTDLRDTASSVIKFTCQKRS